MLKKPAKRVVAKKVLKKTKKSLGTLPSAKFAKRLEYTKVHAVQCLHCLDIIYSCARHDFHPCTCGKIFVDGGFDYTKVSGEPSEMLHLELAIPASKTILYEDWNHLLNERKFGCIQLTKVNSQEY